MATVAHLLGHVAHLLLPLAGLGARFSSHASMIGGRPTLLKESQSLLFVGHMKNGSPPMLLVCAADVRGGLGANQAPQGNHAKRLKDGIEGSGFWRGRAIRRTGLSLYSERRDT